MKIDQLYTFFINSNGITTDTRNIKTNQIYFALKGDNFNGNRFAAVAIEKGAILAVIDEDSVIDITNKDKYIIVNNVLQTLQKLANHHRKQLNIPIIALTGSNGKTTTKELITVVLNQKFKTTATIGNLNNHIGVPLTLLAMNKKTEIGIVEMGANHQKEIEFLCKITEPDFGYITNFGKAHLEGFGGYEGVIKGKSEMYVFLQENNKRAFVNADDELQVKQSKNITSYTFAKNNTDADVVINAIEANPNVKVTFNNCTINTNLIGIYNAANVCAAIAIGKFFEIENDLIKQAIENYLPTNNRSQIVTLNTNKIILDAYNANPSSMDVALANLNQLNTANKIAILGDMFELGKVSDVEHKNIIEKVLSTSINKTYFVGKHFYKNKIEHPNLYFYESLEELKSAFDFNSFSDCTILIKGSRGMALEKILPQ